MNDIPPATSPAAPIPALTIMTGYQMDWGTLVMWTFTVCMVGVVVLIGLRRQLIEVEKLPFPSGFATGKTLQELYSDGKDAMKSLKMLGGMAYVAAWIKFADEFWKFREKLQITGWFAAKPGGGLEKAGLTGFSPFNLGFSIEPTLMMYGIGAIVGPRVGLSVLLGVVVS